MSYDFAMNQPSLLRRLYTRTANALELEARQFYQQSIVRRSLARLHLRVDDKVHFLKLNPLGMFLYNLRALVFAVSGLILAILLLARTISPQPSQIDLSLALLSVAWIIGSVVTLLLHQSFISSLRRWASTSAPRSASPVFNRYFLLDSVLILLILVSASLLHLHLHTFSFLIFANTFLYSAYTRSGYPARRSTSLFISLLAVAALLFVTKGAEPSSSSAIAIVLYLLPIGAMIAVTIFSISMLSWLRTSDHSLTNQHLYLLGKYESLLTHSTITNGDARGDTTSNGQWFWKQVNLMLRDLCSLQPPFWYSSACLWIARDHQDRGRVYVPIAGHEFQGRHRSKNGIDATSGFLESSELTLVPSLRQEIAEHPDKEQLWRFETDRDAPAAIVPLSVEGSVGFLCIYGEEQGPSAQRQEEAFLRSFGSIVGNSISQWQAGFRARSLKEMDELFSCSSLAEVFPRAVRILQRYLFAAGCMILFRPDYDEPEMTIVATEGLRNMNPAAYRVGDGLTGICAAQQAIIRRDDVRPHYAEFDARLLKNLEKAHGHPITSWMAIPIGELNQRNYGVIKVINSRFPCAWFTAYDERIGLDLALRLRVIIERFMQMKHTDQARIEATKSALRAETSKLQAEQTARQRQQDLMNVTHQLQGGLIAVVGALTNIKQDGLQKTSREMLEYAKAFVDDTLALAYGTFTTLARQAGRETAFVTEEIDAPVELERLCRRLQMTNAREDLTFSYKADPGFPRLRMDRNAFTSVMFSLIHNAMKYADPRTLVSLECSFERSTDEAALKLKSIGEPIDPSETELIFDQFRRGRNVERGRRHSGVGLGLWVARELMRANGGDLSVELSGQTVRLSIFIVHVPSGTR